MHPPFPRHHLAATAALVGFIAAGSLVAVAQSPRGIRTVYPRPGAAYVSAGTQVSIFFDRAMDRPSVEAAFSIDPPAAGRFVWTADTDVSFLADEPFPNETTVQATLGVGARDAAGNPILSTPYVWSFTTWRQDPEARFSYGLPAQLVAPATGEGLPIQPGYPRLTFDVTIYGLDEAGFVSRAAGMQPRTPNPIDVGGLPVVARFRAFVDATGTPGEIELPPGLAPGLYVVAATHPRVSAATTLLVYSDYALAAKRGRSGLAFWAASVPDGRVAPGAQVTLYDSAGVVLGQATGDDWGVARFAGTAAAFAAGRVAGQVTMVGLEAPWQSRNYTYWWWDYSILPTPPTLVGHAHTDRPIYRPGHVVHYKATLRRIAADGYEVPDASMPVTITLLDGGGNRVAVRPGTLDEFGSTAGDFALAEDAALGFWTLEARAEGQVVRLIFQVEEYVKPDYEVAVKPVRPWYVGGDEATVGVQADYYFGQPVTGADVTVRVFQGYYWRGSGNKIREVSGTTDATGAFTITMPLPAVRGAQRFTFEAEVVDATRRAVVADASVMVHPAAFALTLRPDRYGIKVGEDFVVTAATIDHDGAPVPGNLIAVRALRYSYPGGYITVDEETLTTGDDGQARGTLDLGAGWYRITASTRDEAGRRLETQTWAWVSDARRPWYWREGLQIDADRDSYSAGDTATLVIRSPVTTTALVTLEREDVVEELIVDVAGATEVEIPIKPEYAPNLWVKVQLWDPREESTYGQSAAVARLISAQTNLLVSAADRRLGVTITADRTAYEPGDSITYEVRVADATGAPVEAQLSFALVDKAVLALAADNSGDIFDAFWGPRGNSVATFDSLRPSDWYEYPEEDLARGGPGAPSPAPTGTPAAGSPGNENQPGEAAPRREFPDTAYWDALIVTGADGVARVTLPLPDNLTTWQATARAITKDSLAGQGSAETLVTKAVIADPALPRFAVQGDTFALDVLARNYTASDLAASCSLVAPGLTQLDPGDRSLALPVNTTQFARWSVVASDLGTSLVTASLATAAGGDIIELPLEVAAFTVPDRFVASGSTEAMARQTITVPFNAVPEASSVEVRLAPAMAVGVLDGLEDLIGYPYGCVEQTMSRLMPDAVIGRLVLELDIVAPEITAELPEMIALGLQKLYGFQNPDGGWGWWRGSSNLYTTAYVLQGLTLVQEAGEDVDPAVLDRGLSWLEGALQNAPDSMARQANLRAYAAYVLSLSGRGDAGVALNLAADAGALDSFSLAAVAMALDAYGRTVESEAILDTLESKAVETATTAHWPFGGWNRRRWEPYWWYTMASREKNTALALEALAQLRPDSPLAPKAAQWLLEHRWGRGWRTTQATAFAVLALTDYIVASGELWSDYDWTVQLDGAEVAAGRVDITNVTKRIAPVTITGDALRPGRHELTLTKRGDGTLFYTVVGQMALFHDGFAPAVPEGLGLGIERSYMPVAGRSGPDGWKVGDVVNVRLTVNVPDDVWYVIVEDMLPAGFEALNEGLDTETGRVKPPEPGFPWRWRGYERKEIRDDRVTFFSTVLYSGRQVFDYAVRAVTPGTFAARPAQAYAMYRPEVWGRSASDQVRIATRQVADRPDLAGDYDGDCRLTTFDAALVAAEWPRGNPGRDTNGDGRVDVADIATAAGRAGAACGDTIPLPPRSGARIALTLEASDRRAPGETFDVVVRAAPEGGGEAAIGAYELVFALGGYEVVAASGGDVLADAYRLGPVAAEGTVRIGAYALTDRPLAPGAILARLTVRGEADQATALGLVRAVVTTGQGAEHAVTFDGRTVSPAPGSRATVFLPRLVQGEPE